VGRAICISHLGIWANRGGVAEPGFYRFPGLGAAEAERCQAVHASPLVPHQHYTSRGSKLAALMAGSLDRLAHCRGGGGENSGVPANSFDEPR